MGRHTLMVAVLVAILLAPVIAPHDPMSTSSDNALQPPGPRYLLGTDALGRDVFSRVLHGGQRTLLIAGAATLVAVVPGLLLGLAAASGPRWLDNLLTVLLNTLLAFPGLVLALVVVTLLGMGPVSVAVATGAALVAGFARVTRAVAGRSRASGFIVAAQSLGAGPLRVVWAHVLPDALPTLLAYAGVTFAYAVLNSAALSFLGLSGSLGVPDWGAMLFDARMVFRAAPWVSIGPGLGVTALVYLVNTLSERLWSLDERPGYL